MKAFDLYEPGSVEEACALLEKFDGKAGILAGGTDLLVELKSDLIMLSNVINLKKIPGLDYITFSEQDGLRIGPLVTWTQILESGPVAAHYPILKRAAETMASLQIRNIATLAGNICHASPAANGPIPLLLYEAACTIQGPLGRRTIPIGELFKGVQANSLQTGEILIEIHLPLPPSHGAAFYKFATRKAMDLAIVGVGALASARNGAFHLARIALGAVAPTPIRARKAEAFLANKKPDENIIRQAAAIAADECSPISDIRASREYRIELIKELSLRAIKESIR